MDDLSDNQFSALARVLNLMSSARDFKFLPSPSNLQAVFAETKDLVVQSVPHFLFVGSGNALTKERVLNWLLTYIGVIVEIHELGKVEDMAIGNDFPIPPPPRHDPRKGERGQGYLCQIPRLSPPLRSSTYTWELFDYPQGE